MNSKKPAMANATRLKTKKMTNFVDSSHNIWNHVEELRQTIIRMMIVIAVGIAVSFWFYPQVFEILTRPLQTKNQGFLHQEIKREKIGNQSTAELLYFIPDSAVVTFQSKGVVAGENNVIIPPGEFILIDRVVANQGLVLFGPIEGMLTTLKTSFWVGLVGTSPIWLMQLLSFIAPGLHPHERRGIFPFLMMSVLFLGLGITFAYFVTIPIANQYLMSFNEGIGINLWSLGNYLDYTVVLLLSSGLAFEIAVVGLFLVHFRVLSVEGMTSKRRYVIVAAFIVAAVLTPPDIFSQFMLAIPLIVLYEGLILYARFIAPKKTEQLV